MNVKNIALLITAIMCYNIVEAVENYQRQAPDAQQAIINLCVERLDTLKEEEKNQYSHTNYCWCGVVVGTGLIVVGALADSKNGQMMAAGATLALASAGLGTVSMVNENFKATHRSQERVVLLDRLNKLPRQ